MSNPQLWMENITPPPANGPARETWQAAMRQVLAYRDRYQVTDLVDPLGPHLAEGERGEAYGVAARALEAITTDQELRDRQEIRFRRRPMERVPVVLAYARSRAARIPHDAAERARRDAIERASEQHRGW
jgi:hypothetical protein